MTTFSDHLLEDLTREHGARLDQMSTHQADHSRGRRRMFAGGTLGLAGLGAGLVLALSGSTAAPAFAITRADDGTVTVTISQTEALPQVNQKLADMGTGESVSIRMASGDASTPGAVTCTPSAGVNGPTVKLLNGQNGTEVIVPTAQNEGTGVGTWHLASCVTLPASGSTTGNSGS